MMEVLSTAALTTVQDLGRQGMRRYGVGVGGCMDSLACEVGGIMLGNRPDSAAVEINLTPFSVRFRRDAAICLTGGDFDAVLDGRPVSPWWAVPVLAGQKLELRRAVRGARAYLCVAGGIAVPAVLGSRSTHLRGQFGGLEGRQLVKGDTLPLGEPRAVLRRAYGIHSPAEKLTSWRDAPGEITVRAMPAGEYEGFTEDAIASFWGPGWRIGLNSNRMGYRLEGARRLALRQPMEMRSHGVMPGVIQVPPGGQPIVLMADTNVSGGYPKIATVISADLWRVAQAPLGSVLRFVQVDRDHAVEAMRQRIAFLEELKSRVERWVLPAARSCEA